MKEMFYLMMHSALFFYGYTGLNMFVLFVFVSLNF